MLAQPKIEPARNVQPYVRPEIQPKLKVGRQDDARERQADRVANSITGEKPESGLKLIPPDSQAGTIRMMPMQEESQTPPINMDTDPSVRMVPASGNDSHDRDAGFIEMHISKSGNGQPLDGPVRSYMESGFGRSFENVRIHTDTRAAAMAESIGARAFTFGNDIYFNAGEYNPESAEGKKLIAHELTHTVQQSGAGSKESGVVQPSLFRRAASSIRSGLRRAAEWVGESLSEGLRWLRGRISNMISALPGFGLFTVFLGRNPITGESVARNGRNFIHHGLDIIPNGAEYRQKLEEEGALDEAAAWIDNALEQLNLSTSDIMGRFRQFWDSLSLNDVGNPSGVFDRLVSLFSDPVNSLITFAVSLARKFLEIVKNYLLSKLRDWVENRESPTWYPLITVILGRDPIMNEEVERSGENILNGFIRLHPEGDEQLARMRETGSFQRAAAWIDESLARLSRIVSGLTSAVRNAWERVTDIRSLLDPVGVFTNIWNEFRSPIADLVSFGLEVAGMILRFVKDALLSRLSRFASETWGYPLLTVLLGRDPFTNETVERTPKNIIRSFILLLPGGEQKFSRLEETGAIDRMVNWISGAVASLNITIEYIVGLFTGLWNSISIRDLAAPLQVFARIVNTFAEPVRRILAFIWEVIKALVMFGLEVMNFPFDTVRNIVNNAMQAFEDIKTDPIGFFLNLLAAVKQGFVQFFNNFVDHLLGGLRTWLFGELRDAGISPPQDLSFRSILGFVLEILGITLSNIWARLSERIGPERTQQIQSMIDRATGVWAFVKDVYERGPVAIWEYIQGKLSNLWDMITGYIRDWIVTRIIQRVTARLLTMLDPTGIMAVVNGFIAFYNAVQSFIEKLREMLEIVNSFVAGVANVARGVISQAANYLENALASGIPVAISFLANQVGLRGLGTRVAEMIEQARGYVNQAIDWLIDRALAAGSALLEMGRSAVSAVSDWLTGRSEFRTEAGESHEIYLIESSGHGTVMMASANPKNVSEVINQHENSSGDLTSRGRSIYQNILSLTANPQTAEENEARITQLRNELATVIKSILDNSSQESDAEGINSELPLIGLFLNTMVVQNGAFTADFDSAVNGPLGAHNNTPVYVLRSDLRIQRAPGMADSGFMALTIINGELRESTSEQPHGEYRPENVTLSAGTNTLNMEYSTNTLSGGTQNFEVELRYTEIEANTGTYTEARTVRGTGMHKKPSGRSRGSWDSATNGFHNAHLIGDQFGGSGYNESLNIHPSSPGYNTGDMLSVETSLISSIDDNSFTMTVSARIFHQFSNVQRDQVREGSIPEDLITFVVTKMGEPMSVSNQMVNLEGNGKSSLRRYLARYIRGVPGKFIEVHYRVQQEGETYTYHIGQDQGYDSLLPSLVSNIS